MGCPIQDPHSPPWLLPSPLFHPSPRCSPNFSALLLRIFQMEGDFPWVGLGLTWKPEDPAQPGGLCSNPTYFAYEAPVSVASLCGIPFPGPTSEQHRDTATGPVGRPSLESDAKKQECGRKSLTKHSTSESCSPSLFPKQQNGVPFSSPAFPVGLFQ